MGSKREFVAGREEEGLRVDRLLASVLEDLSRNYIQTLIQEGHISLQGKPVKASYRVKAGDALHIDIPPPQKIELNPQPLPLSVLYEDPFLIVVDKQAGMVVHPAPGHSQGTLVNALLYHCKDLKPIGGSLRPGIVHRLDRDTSGVMVVAKEEATHKALIEAFKERKVKKVYLALVGGSLPSSKGRIDAPVGRDPRHRKQMATHVPRARNASTDYVLLESAGDLALVALYPRTGRTHQIRVHLKHLGCSIAGDTIYARGVWKGAADRQMLHAHILSFVHPQKQEPVTFQAPIPQDFMNLAQEQGLHPQQSQVFLDKMVWD